MAGRSWQIIGKLGGYYGYELQNREGKKIGRRAQSLDIMRSRQKSHPESVIWLIEHGMLIEQVK